VIAISALCQKRTLLFHQGRTVTHDALSLDKQINGRKPHASAGLNGWIGFKNKAIRERADLPHYPSLQSI
jgi:hypothetical protein